MAGEKQVTDSSQSWPLPAFYFKVTIEDVGNISFKEVSGLDVEYDLIEYRAGDSKEFSKVKMPGLRKFGDITLKKGVFKSDKKLWDWIGQIKLNTIKRVGVTICLLDEAGEPAQTWKLINAWPKKITVEGFKADTGTEPAMETLVFVCEGITVE